MGISTTMPRRCSSYSRVSANRRRSATTNRMLHRERFRSLGGKTGYTREQFGPAWADVDRNGCDTRNDILRRDLTGVVFTESSTCRVAAGSFHEPYTGQLVDFRRGQESSKAVQIDHVIRQNVAHVEHRHQRLPAREQIDRLSDRAAVTPLAVDAERAHPLQEPAVDAAVLAEHVPRRHEVKRPPRLRRDVHHDRPVGKMAVIRAD